MRLKELIAPMPWDGDNPDIAGLSCDSRTVKPGTMFAALPGNVADGRDYISSAVKNGASAILSTPGLSELDIPYIGHENPRLFYSRLASRLYPGQPETLVAMTGTNGKSSTVEFLRQIWEYAGLKSACFGTLGIKTSQGLEPLSHTTPDAVALHKTLSKLVDKNITHVGMEASSHGLKQYRLDNVKITAAGFSNLTQDHFDYHPDIDDYFEAKARLFLELTPATAPVVINVNDPYGQKLALLCKDRGQDVMQVGWTGKDIHIDEVMPKAASQLLTLGVQGKRYEVTLPLAGEFQTLNAVAALGLALLTGINKETALEAIENLKGVAGRMEEAGRTSDGAPIFVDFAHTEDGLDKLLRSVRPHTMGRIILAFGCGGDRDPDKRPKMGVVAAKLADHVIVTDDNPRTENAAKIRKAVLDGCPDADEVGDRASAIRKGIKLLRPEDCLVVAGKGHEQGQIVGDKVIPFSDVEQVRLALKELDHV